MKKIILFLFLIISLNGYSQYDDLYYNGYGGTTYLTYNHFPNYSARLNFFYGGGLYLNWSLFNFYWYTPYYSAWYYPYNNYYSSWYYPRYYRWYNRNYYTHHHHHYRKGQGNRNTFYGHRKRISSNNRTTVYKSKPIKPTTPRKVVKTPTKVVTTVKHYNRPTPPQKVVKNNYSRSKPTTYSRSNITYQRPRSTTTRPTRTYTQRRPTRSYKSSTPTRISTPRRRVN